MKKPTSTFWICLSILTGALMIGLFIWQSNRYVYDDKDGAIVDKYTGQAKYRQLK